MAKATTLDIQAKPARFPQNDKRATRNGEPLAYIYDITATDIQAGKRVTHFQNEVALVFNVNPAELAAAGVHGWPLQVYTYDETQSSWVKVPTWWNAETSQLVALTNHFSVYAAGSGLDAINNYVPSIKDFENDLQTGAATVSYPLNIPPGPGGFGPRVALSYNSSSIDRISISQQGPSSIGWGWTLSSNYISASQHFFGDYSPWTASIVADGANGDLTKGQDGYWHTSNESFVKVLYVSNTDTWEAWGKDGTHYEFTAKTRVQDKNNRDAAGNYAVVTNRWMLTRATDVHNNTIIYDYLWERQDDDPADGVQLYPADPGGFIRAIYPDKITYGGGQLLVDFDHSPRLDHWEDDSRYEIFQSNKINRITVKRRDKAGVYQPLRSYVLQQDYSTSLSGVERNPDNTLKVYGHLTLSAIIPQGSDLHSQLPSSTFVYYKRRDCYPNCGNTVTPVPGVDNITDQAQDWGHLFAAKNGYGGEVRYVYDAAGNGQSSYYRRVRAKLVMDGIAPNNIPAEGTSTVHNSWFLYTYRGANRNGDNISSEVFVDRPLHLVDTEFRGYAWVREQDPSNQVIDHFFNQDDYTKGQEWRSQVGKATITVEPMDAPPASNSYWNIGPGVAQKNGGDYVGWKLQPTAGQPNSFIERTLPASALGIRDGNDLEMKILMHADDTNTNHRLTGKWKLVAENGDYLGLEISRVHYQATGYEYEAKVSWSKGGVTGTRNLDRGSTLLPRMNNSILSDSWYLLRFHPSPDGRFAIELMRDNPGSSEYILIKSGDAATTVSSGSATVPYFGTGLRWKFREEASTYDVNDDYTVIDDYREIRTLYSQSDTMFKLDYPLPATASPQLTGNTQWWVGDGNTCGGMRIQFIPVQTSYSTVFGDACCEADKYALTRSDYEYDSFGNQVLAKSYGDLVRTASGDRRSTLTEYAVAIQPASPNGVPLQQYIVDRVKRVRSYQGFTNTQGTAGTLMADIRYFYDGKTDAFGVIPPPNATPRPGRGDVTQVRRVSVVNGAEDASGPISVEYSDYDSYGNLTFSKDAVNPPTTTTYDDYYHSFPVKVTHPNGSSVSTDYDFGRDTPRVITDVNGTVTQLLSDPFGRPQKSWISKPTGYGSEAQPNESYTFQDLAAPATPTVTGISAPLYISYQAHLGTKASDNANTWQMRWFDGLGRTIQDVSPRDGTNTIMVDTAYNTNGQVIRMSLPYTVGNSNRFIFRPPTGTEPSLTKTYDGIGRPLITTNADGTITWSEYKWLYRLDTVDEAGHRRAQSTDAFGKVQRVYEYDNTANYGHRDVITEYKYDVLGNLTTVIRDNEPVPGAVVPSPTKVGYETYRKVTTSIEYDGLGRKKAMTDPDMGRWEYKYDAVGNLSRQRDAIFNQDPTTTDPVKKQHQVFFTYDSMNRIKAKYYGADHFNDTNNDGVPEGTPDARYFYDNDLGDASTMLSWGNLRKAEVTGAYGQAHKANAHTYTYDSRGMLLTEQVTSALNPGRIYEVKYDYDDGGRLWHVTYPDAEPAGQHEQVEIRYNQQAIGLPLWMKTNKSTIYPVRNATYNQRGQLTTLDQGSFTLSGDRLLTSFSYDDSTKRRGRLTGTTVSRGVNSPPAAADVLLNLKMDYFDNGNVKSVQQTAGGTADNPTFTNNYDYDGQERLRYAESKGADGTVATGIFPWEAYSFDSLNRMTERRIGGATYPYAYEAPNTSPKHVDAPTDYMGYHYDYDANGSQIKRTGNGSGQDRVFDPEGRLESISEGSTISTFIYDANGQRLVKSVSNNAMPVATATPENGLRGEYYATASLSNYKMTRYDGPINSNWGIGSPDPALPANAFSVRWTGRIRAYRSSHDLPSPKQTPTTFTFYTVSDEGVRLWVNNQLVIDNWTPHSQTENTGSISLMPNSVYDIKLEYYEGNITSNAAVQLLWYVPRNPLLECEPDCPPTKQLVPLEALYPPTTGGSLLGEYYDNSNFTNLKLSRLDPGVSFNWGSGSPDASIGVDTYSVRWTGKVKATTTGTYTFYTMSDDGVRLTVNGQQIINNWTDHAVTENQGQVTLTGGQEYDIKLEYYENGWGATIELRWLPPGGTKQVIPSGQFSPASILSATSRTLYISNLYEEELTGSTTPPYTSYYTFAGKVVGMRKANQLDSVENRQYRLVGDHLGSSTLIVDTSSPPQVLHRQYYKPYGEALTFSGKSQTTIGYTGQRLDGETGLMFYNARFYDPVLSFFVSPDTIAPNSGEPKSNNRYSYTLNNPIKYVDPTGHCTDQVPDSRPGNGGGDRRTCKELQDQLRRYGFTLGAEGLANWEWEELTWILEALDDLMRAAGWSVEDLRYALNIADGNLITLAKADVSSIFGSFGGAELTTAQDYCEGTFCWPNQHMYGDPNTKIYMDFDQIRQTFGPEAKAVAKFIFIHELAHAWENRNRYTSRGYVGDGTFSANSSNFSSWLGMIQSVTGVKPTRPLYYGHSLSRLAQSGTDGSSSREEDWADSVAATVYPRVPWVEWGFKDSARYNYVMNTFRSNKKPK